MWKEIPEYEGRYLISDEGECKSVERKVWCKTHYQTVPERTLTPQFNKLCGYYEYEFSVNGQTNREFVHRVVAKTFIPNPENFPVINHIDGNKLNNHVTNLEWCTQRDNVIHAIQTGLVDNEKLQDSLSLGHKWVAEHSHKIICIEDNIEFPNKEAAAKYYDVDKDNILECISWGRVYKKIDKSFKYSDNYRQEEIARKRGEFFLHFNSHHFVKCLTDGNVFKNRTQCAKFYNVDTGVISRALLLHRPTEQGLSFEWEVSTGRIRQC